VANILAISSTVLMKGLGCLLGWKSLPLFGRYGYVKMIKCLTIKIFSFAGYLLS
jgi:hypothetical protein